jgi:sterol desaturase/sphingolipid hydroxylase (fatty acid hydroxylase superfamily)
MNKWASYSLYPATLFSAFLLYFVSYSYTHSYMLSLYVGVSSCAGFIFVLEKIIPMHHEWKPTNKELISDLFQYTVFVQALLPLILYFGGIKLLSLFHIPSLSIWPSSLPVLVQVLLMAVIGEFFQYWWHRLTHTYKTLWPIHAIHHFPHKLYAWNTARFHPLDKLVEFIFTLFIFFAAGMSLEVFSYYYIFYAITGYFQHSNLDVKFGPFDYVIASGETHRFHHDSNFEMSKCNYANNLVLFDLLFGTFKKSSETPLKVVGVKHGIIPKDFLGETLYPLVHWKQTFFDLLLAASMKKVEKTFVKELELAANDPQSAQTDILNFIIKENAGTLFGKEHHFEEIKNYEDFKSRVPVMEFEDHRKYIDQILAGQSNVLTAEPPHYFAKTSGTTGKPKYIPINLKTQKRYMRTQQLIAHALYKKRPDFLSGEIFSIVGNEVEEVLAGKYPCGSMSGKLYSLTNPLVRAKHVFQTEISLLNDSEKKYLYLAALAVLSPRITFYASPNPSSLVKIFETLNTKKADIKKLLQNKDDQILKKFSHNREHALKLIEGDKTLTIKDVWPGLKAATLWMDGSCSFLIPKLKNSAGKDVLFNELGYVASEFYGTVNGIPTLLDNFFEFIERSHYENGGRDTQLIHQLETGKEYYIIATTTAGLYRYFINDIIKVTGKFKETPVINFSQKGKGITNLTGEKLSEKQLVSFFEEKHIDFFMCLADQQTQNYQLYLEAENTTDLEKELDAYLISTNIEFASKRKDGRLSPITIIKLNKGTADAYKDFCLKNGQRESQFKFLHLQYAADVTFDFKGRSK